jgi:hypothetical protein
MFRFTIRDLLWLMVDFGPDRGEIELSGRFLCSDAPHAVV